MSESLSPQIEAMQRAMRAAEEAAEKRRLAKLAAREAESDFAADEDLEVIMATAVGSLPDDAMLEEAFDLEATGELGDLLAQLDAAIPELDDREVHGDLVVFRPQDPAKPWYQSAAEEALPAPLRDLAGPIDVKMMLQAVLVELGDVKRTNAILMETLARLEEKVDRTNRLMRERRQP